MNERSNSQSKSKPSRNEMEVEQLLQAAQDELVLNLSINSHMSRVSPNYIDSDLDRRFQALKKSGSSVVPQESSNKKELKAVMGDDLSARFAALKGSSSSSSSTPGVGVGVGPNNILSDDGDGDEDEEDEVEKLIRWAKDAARLDPSPPSDDDDHDEDEEEEEEDDDDDEEEDYKDEHQKPKGHHHRK